VFTSSQCVDSGGVVGAFELGQVVSVRCAVPHAVSDRSLSTDEECQITAFFSAFFGHVAARSDRLHMAQNVHLIKLS
jgi:hypothetical protein